VRAYELLRNRGSEVAAGPRQWRANRWVAELLGLLTACHPERTVLFRNEGQRAVTLVLPALPAARFRPGTPRTISLAVGTRRDSVLRYGAGAWTVTDQNDLRQVLGQSRLVVGPDTLPLAPYAKLIGTYRVTVNEFYVKIKPPQPPLSGH
jgi:hypothetical protein